MEANWVRKQLKAVIQQNHLDPVVFHSLRNSSTSLKLELSKGDIKAAQGDTGHAQASMVTDVYARTNNTQCKKLARLVEQNFFETMKEKTGDPNFNQTEKNRTSEREARNDRKSAEPAVCDGQLV